MRPDNSTGCHRWNNTLMSSTAMTAIFASLELHICGAIARTSVSSGMIAADLNASAVASQPASQPPP